MTPALPSGIDISAFDDGVHIGDDLFRHVNGKWIDAHEIPADRSIDGAFRQLVDLSEARVKGIIEDSAKAAESGSVAAKVGDMFASFMDTERIENLGVAPIAGPLASIAEVADKQQFAALLGTLSRVGVGGATGIYIDNDSTNPELYRAYFYQSGLGLPDEAYYREDQYEEIRAEYVKHIAKLLKLAGVAADFGVGTLDTVTDHDYEVAAQKVMDLETKLAKYHWDVVKDRDMALTYNPMPWADLVKSAPEFDWNAWVTALGSTPAAMETVVVREPSFINGFGRLWESEPLDNWKLWAAYHLITGAAGYLNDEMVEANFDFYGRTLAGTPEVRERWKRGVSAVEGALGEAVGEVYVGRYFPQAYKARMDELVGNLIAAYRESIKELDWMSPATKEKALEKLEKFNPKIGYPVKWRDYSKLEIKPDDLVGNITRAQEFATDRELAKLGKPLDRDEWFMTPQTVNAYYNPGLNEIVFPAAILEPPFFNAEADDAVNYGGIGGVIGHEIGHGFDDQGSKYDGDGRLQDWWTPEDRSAFEERTGALIEQYNAFVPEQLAPDGPHVNGALTIGENIGDLGGLAIAIKAYAISLAKKAGHPNPTPEQEAEALANAPVIDGLTGLQRVFYGWAQVWQTKARDELVELRIATDPHSPAEFRCNGVVRNVDAFYDAFNIAEDNSLYIAPENRVKIW